MMVAATADPLVEIKEEWQIRSPETYLVVFRYALGIRLYLFENPTPAQVQLLVDCHNQFVNDVSAASSSICSIPRNYPDHLIYDTAENGQMPLIEKPTHIILTGL